MQVRPLYWTGFSVFVHEVTRVLLGRHAGLQQTAETDGIMALRLQKQVA